MVGATLPHVDFVIADQDMSVDDAAAVWANASSQLIENVVRIFLWVSGGRCYWAHWQGLTETRVTVLRPERHSVKRDSE